MKACDRAGARPVLVAALAVLCAAVPAAARAQTDYAVELLAGATSYDLSGTGTSAFYGARALLPLGDYVAAEPSLEYFGYDPQLGDRAHLLFPEVQLQLRLPAAGGAVWPYLGIGTGFAVPVGSNGGRTEATLSAALGARIRLSPGVGVLGEARLRSVDPWAGSMGNFGIGVWWEFF